MSDEPTVSQEPEAGAEPEVFRKPGPSPRLESLDVARLVPEIAAYAIVILGFFGHLPRYASMVPGACCVTLWLAGLMLLRALSELPGKLLTPRVFWVCARLCFALAIPLMSVCMFAPFSVTSVRPLGLPLDMYPVALLLAAVPLGLIAYDVWRGKADLGFTLLILFLIGALVVVPRFKSARERANTRACFANQKTIRGAVEMYALDKNLKAPALSEGFFNKLKSGGYLRSTPQDPGQGPHTEEHYVLELGGNGIRCTVHGPVQ